MKKLFDSADWYLAESDWKDIALIKFCLCSMGVVIGASLPKKAKKGAVGIASAVFLSTYVPLMSKYLKIALQNMKDDETEIVP